MMTRFHRTTPLGVVTLFWKQQTLVGLDLSPAGQYRGAVQKQLDRYLPASAAPEEETEGDRLFFSWLDRYLKGEDCPCPVPYELHGSDFQQRVWQQLADIPRGTVWTYGQLAQSIGSKATRAVGTAVGHNPLPILLPCHRVVRQGGAAGAITDENLGQFSAGEGPATKRFLLRLEGALPASF